MFMAAIPIERDAVVWARLRMKICPVQLGVLSVVSTMANSLIAVVSYFMHCKVCYI